MVKHMLENLSYNQFWLIFFNLAVLVLVAMFYWLFNPQRKCYAQKLEENKKR